MPKVKTIARETLRNALKIKAVTLRTYISKGTIKEVEKGWINVYNPKNQEWILSYCDKYGIDYKEIFDRDSKIIIGRKKKQYVSRLDIEEEERNKEPEPSVNNNVSNNQDDSEDQDDSEVGKTQSQLREEKLKKEVKKLDIETRLKNLEFDKKKAKVVPVDFCIELINIYLKGTYGGIINKINSLLELMSDECDISTPEKLKYMQKAKQMINEEMSLKSENVRIEAKDYAEEYALLTKW